MNRRLYDGGLTYSHGQALQHWNIVQGWSAWALGVIQILFIVNLVWSWKRGRAAGTNPWEATTLEWQTTSPPAEHNFAEPPTVGRGPYEYSVPGDAKDFRPQHVAPTSHVPPTSHVAGTSHIARADTRVNNVTLGMWLFIASEVMLFGGLFSAYVLLRSGAAMWGAEGQFLSITKGLGFSAILFLATALMSRGRPSSLLLAATLGITFLLLKGYGYWALIQAGLLPSSSTFLALYYLLTGVHLLHVLAGVALAGYLSARGASSTGGDEVRFDSRVRALTLFWYFVDIVWTASSPPSTCSSGWCPAARVGGGLPDLLRRGGPTVARLGASRCARDGWAHRLRPRDVRRVVREAGAAGGRGASGRGR